MDKFIVSARKYRPQNFSTVVGQQHITTTLKNAIKNHQLAHAFLFCGPRGVGKTTCARILAKTINCENPTPDGEACNECHSCVSFNDGVSLNIHELDAASNNSVDDIRSLVDQVRFAPQAGKYKVYIIDEVHMLSTSAFNAFLKTLEEPPSYAIFILATTEKHKILPTILSRCQIFDFKRITLEDTVEHLQEIVDKEEIHADKASLQVIAQKSEGCMRDALSILDKIVSFTNGEVKYQQTLEHLNILDADYYFRLLDCMQQQQLAEAMLLYDDINRKGFEGDMVLNGFAEFIRNLLVCKDEKAASLLQVVEGFRDRYVETAKATGTAYLVSALNLVAEAELNYRTARNKRLHVELALIKLCYLQQALEITGEPEGVQVKKKVSESARAMAFRNLTPIEPVKKAKEKPLQPKEEKAKLIIETNTAGSQFAPGPTRELSTTKQAAKPTATSDTITAPAPVPTLAALSKLRKEVTSRQQNGIDIVQRPLTLDNLQQAWTSFATKLREGKNPAFQSFERAVLKITDANNFEVITHNNLEQKFIEQEKRNACDHLQQAFNNKSISFNILVSENHQPQPVNSPPNKREQYQRIIEQYPLVRELKERLNLELDY